jgi:hypothetical protein
VPASSAWICSPTSATAKGRQQVGLMRQITETLANVAYLCGDDEQGARHRAFLYDSLISEREFLKVIERRQANGPGTELPIERRLRRSIEDTARAAGINLEASQADATSAGLVPAGNAIRAGQAACWYS